MTTRRKRILLVKPIVPYPPDQGTKIVSFDMIQGLSQAFDVTVLCRTVDAATAAAADDLGAYCSEVIAMPAPNRRSVFHRILYKVAYSLRSLITRRSMKSLYDCPGAFVRCARKLAAEEFDLIVVEYWQMFPLLDVFPHDRTVLLTHDVDMLVNRQSALLEKNLLKKIAAVRRWMLEQREELRAYRKARTIIALTERDADAVRKLAGVAAAIPVLPFGLDPAHYGSESIERRRDEVLFMGALNSGFNRDALQYFARNIYPHLDQDRVEVKIVGGVLPPELAFFGTYDNVEAVGRVDDVRPFLSRAACLIIPLRFGGGLRIRILEAMMAGTPIACTSVAIAGMDFTPESDYLLADDPRELARQVMRLIDDPDLAGRIASSAHSRVIDGFDRSRQAGRLRELAQHLMTT